MKLTKTIKTKKNEIRPIKRLERQRQETKIREAELRRDCAMEFNEIPNRQYLGKYLSVWKSSIMSWAICKNHYFDTDEGVQEAWWHVSCSVCISPVMLCWDCNQRWSDFSRGRPDVLSPCSCRRRLPNFSNLRRKIKPSKILVINIEQVSRDVTRRAPPEPAPAPDVADSSSSDSSSDESDDQAVIYISTSKVRQGSRNMANTDRVSKTMHL